MGHPEQVWQSCALGISCYFGMFFASGLCSWPSGAKSASHIGMGCSGFLLAPRGYGRCLRRCSSTCAHLEDSGLLLRFCLPFMNMHRIHGYPTTQTQPAKFPNANLGGCTKHLIASPRSFQQQVWLVFLLLSRYSNLLGHVSGRSRVLLPLVRRSEHLH